MSDFEYDALEVDLKDFEKENPELVHPNSPTKKIGSSDWETYPRSIRMMYQYEYLTPPIIKEEVKQIKKDIKKINTIWD